MRTYSGTIAFTWVVVLGLAGPTQAGSVYQWDYKNYPGAACLPETIETYPGVYRQPNRIQHGGWKGDVPMRVICPIVRDNVLPSPSIDASVTGSPDLDCRFWSIDPAGVPAASVGYSSYEDFSPTVRKFYYVLKHNQTPFDGTFTFRCTLMPGQFIIQYNVGELTQGS